ncbi:nuclear transport factor 2 family protein [Chryseolinea sp. T2]|uniref:nuclear transport factor 2 family protein n=1 Tax=Chryseolinea sp. T2 TaxID=3129255 RepID=UPI003076D949
MKTLFTTLVAVLLVSASFAQSKTDAEIKKLSKDRIKWLLEGKADSLATLYDQKAVTVHGNGMVKSTEEQLQDVKKGVIKYNSIDVSEMTVTDFGKTAVLVGKGVFNIEVGGSKMTANMAYTEVYLKSGKTWKLIARHASPIQ